MSIEIDFTDALKVRPGVLRYVRQRLIRLGPSQLVILAAGVLTVLCVTYLVAWPAWLDLYTRAYALPRMEERWGFEFGTIRVQRDGVEYDWEGIVSLAPNSRLARLGLRQHDAPHLFHGRDGVIGAFQQALLASERGEAAGFPVMNVDDWAAGDQEAIRPIQFQPVR